MAFLNTHTYIALSIFVNCCCIKGKPYSMIHYHCSTCMLKLHVLAILELENSGVLYVCLRGQLNVTCSTSTDTLRWNIAIPQYPIFRRGLSKIGTADMTTPIPTNLTMLYVSRSLNDSSSLDLPLSSTIFTYNATADLNGTLITCSAEIAGESQANDSLQIILARNNSGNISSRLSINVN